MGFIMRKVMRKFRVISLDKSRLPPADLIRRWEIIAKRTYRRFKASVPNWKFIDVPEYRFIQNWARKKIAIYQHKQRELEDSVKSHILEIHSPREIICSRDGGDYEVVDGAV